MFYKFLNNLNLDFLPEFFLLLYLLITLLYITSKKLKTNNLLEYLIMIIKFLFLFLMIILYKKNYSLNNYFIIDQHINLLKLLIILTVLFSLIYLKLSNKNRGSKNEYLILILGILFFLLLFISSFNILILFITLIGFSIFIYTLIIKEKSTRENKVLEAGFKYFFMSTFSSMFILFSLI